jgi:tetratricopeptide (TPR) repeat protein
MPPDRAAEADYLDRLRRDPTQLEALMGLGSIALATGRRDAARTIFGQATRHHPAALGARVTLGNMAIEDGAAEVARCHFQSALARDAGCAEASQGMARALALLGEHEAAEAYWQAGFAGHAIAPRRYRGARPAREVLYLAAARGGNVRLWPWLDESRLAVSVVYADYLDPARPLPPHQMIVNAIGDADHAAVALARAERLVSSSDAPVINHPSRVGRTGRSDLPALCAGVEGLIAPRIRRMSRAALLTAEDLAFPLLLRAPGFHTGRHFARVETREAMAAATEDMPGDELFAIEALDARAPDGMVRKYRVMLVGGRIYPWHLAISPHWKVHYYTAAMAEHPAYRAEEGRFLSDMESVLGPRAMAALQALSERLGLDYAGVDFARAPDGALLVFEANAVMTLNLPPPEPIWDYRRPAAAAVQFAVRNLLSCL